LQRFHRIAPGMMAQHCLNGLQGSPPDPGVILRLSAFQYSMSSRGSAVVTAGRSRFCRISRMLLAGLSAPMPEPWSPGV
jgi:hypothetical protein